MRKSRSSVALVKPERWASSASIAETPTSFDSVSFYSLFRAKPVLLTHFGTHGLPGAKGQRNRTVADSLMKLCFEKHLRLKYEVGT
ncbi:MAG: hypothetical protein E2O76_01550 [Caldithrix sp.]|nr:MAG: hypothetical protein E2O76_01550 [Caldithrix sp.]